MNIYFDHKIADFVSTAALFLTIGIVPNNNAYKGEYCNFRYDNEENEYWDHQTYEPLISNCSYKHLFDEYAKKYNGNINRMRIVVDDSQLLRCPYAWYKKINYETGEVDLTGTRIIQDANEENDSRVGAADHGGKTTNTKFGGNKRKKTRKKYLTKKKSRKRRSRRRRRRRHTAKKKKV